MRRKQSFLAAVQDIQQDTGEGTAGGCVEADADQNMSVCAQRNKPTWWATLAPIISVCSPMAISFSCSLSPSQSQRRAGQAWAIRALPPQDGHLAGAAPNQRRNRRLGSRQNTRWRCIAERPSAVMPMSVSPLLANSCGWSPRDEPGSRSTRKCNDAHLIKRHFKVFLKVVLNAPHRYPFPKIVPHRK